MDNDLYQQMADLGLLDEQDAGLAQQIKQAQAMRQKPRYQGTDGVSAAIGGLGDILNAVGSQRKEQQANDQQQALRGQRSVLKRSVNQSASTMPVPDIGAYEGEADPVRAEAAKQKYLADVQQQRNAGMAMRSSTDPSFQQTGQDFLSQAGQAGNALQAATNNRLTRTLQAQREKQLETYQGRQQTETERHNRAAERVMGARVAGGGAPAGPGLSPEALDQAAEMFAQTATMPQLGMGRSSVGIRQAIINRAAELHPGGALAGNKASYKSDSQSLAKLQTQKDAVEAFENTALANLHQFLESARGLGIDYGSPLFNAPARKFAEMVAGDPKMTEFTVARQAAVQEVGKVLSGAVGNGAISEGARHEVEGLLKGDATIAQIEHAAAILERDMGNRKKSYDQQIGSIHGRLFPGKTPGETGTPAAPQGGAAPGAPPGMKRQVNTRTGEVRYVPDGR